MRTLAIGVLAALSISSGDAQDTATEAKLSGSALIDPDLYSERIDLFETADYFQQVYLNYGLYKLIYAK